MTPFLSEKKLTTSPGAGAGPAVLPEGLRPRPSGSAPQRVAQPSFRAGAGPGPRGPGWGRRRGQAGRRAAARTDRPLSRCPRPAPRRRPDKCERDPRLLGRKGRERTGGPGADTAPRAGPGPPPRPRAAKPLSVQPPGWGATRTRQLHGGGGSRKAEAPNPGARRDHRAIAPWSSAGAADSRKDPSRDREILRKCPYLRRRRALTLARPEFPPLLPPKTSRPGGEMGEEGRRVQRLLRLKLRLLLLPRRRLVPLFGGRSGSLAGGRGGTTKNPSRTGGPGPGSRCPPEDSGARPSAAPSGQRSRRWPWRRQASALESPSAPAPELLTPDSTDGQTSLPPPTPRSPLPSFSPPLDIFPSPTSFPDGPSDDLGLVTIL